MIAVTAIASNASSIPAGIVVFGDPLGEGADVDRAAQPRLRARGRGRDADPGADPRAPPWPRPRRAPGLYVTRPRVRVDEAVLAALDQPAQAVERVPDVGVARVERRDAEPDRVRARGSRGRRAARSISATLIGHASGWRERRRASRGRAASRGEPSAEAERREPGVVERDDQLGQRDRLRADARRCPPRRSARALLDRGEREDRRRAGQEAPDRRRPGRSRAPSRTGRAGRTSPRSASAAPPGARSATYRKAGRARARVEVLVGAADRELGAGARAARPAARRPSGRGPRRRRRSVAAGERGHVGDRARAVVDVREHDERGAALGDRVLRRRRPAAARGRCARRGPRARSGRSGSCRGR